MTITEMIRDWLKEAKEKGATHMLVVVDTFDYEDYPVYVMPGQNYQEIYDDHNKNMQRVMEVYNLSTDVEEQLAEKIAHHI